MITSRDQKSLPTIGFLTVIRDSEEALFGGYLVLDALGRPLEFHCTAPVRPNRAQQILYGPSLKPYLYGDRIGQTLFNASKRTPTLAITDAQPVMMARDLIGQPLALLIGRQQASDEAGGQTSPNVNGRRIDAAHTRVRSGAVPLERFQLADYQMAVTVDHAQDRQVWVEQWPEFTDQLDLEEPFSRIREAIDEARRGAH